MCPSCRTAALLLARLGGCEDLLEDVLAPTRVVLEGDVRRLVRIDELRRVLSVETDEDSGVMLR